MHRVPAEQHSATTYRPPTAPLSPLRALALCCITGKPDTLHDLPGWKPFPV